MSEPTLSIIIPVYNTKDYIERCVKSVIHQIDERVEIVLVDDGSSDGSSLICDEYTNQYSFISVVHKQNGGLASARNVGMLKARGEYINFLDSDDWLGEGAVEKLLNIIERDNPDIIGFGCQKTTGKTVFKKYNQRWSEGLHVGDSIIEIREDIVNDKELFEFNVIRSSCMHVFKSSIIEKLKLQFISERIVLNEDYLFVTSFVSNATSYYCCKDYFYNYYNRENSLTTIYLTEMYERKNELYKRYYSVLRDQLDSNKEIGYRLQLFYLNNCYECLANECGVHKPNKRLIQNILDDIKSRDVIRNVRIEDQTKKAKIFLLLMKKDNADMYIISYKIFGFLKELKWNFKKKARL